MKIVAEKKQMDIEGQARSTVLIIDDEENMRHMLEASLRRDQYQVITARDGREGLQCIEETGVSLILCDMKMPQMGGLEFLYEANLKYSDLTIIMMSAFATVDTAVKAMKAGAYDVITKPFRLEEVLCVLKKAEERVSLQTENSRLKNKIAELSQRQSFSKLIGTSEPILKVLGAASRVARLDTTVLITGESGTGKELIARGIQQASQRAEQTFISVNCGAIPEQLLESEFFGVVRGAFTGAENDRKGLFREANKGTIFLDEIGELPISLQVKLLRVLQEMEIRPVGASLSEKIDVRVIAATSKNLQDEARSGRFRPDLLYRLNVVELHLPPLRERGLDVTLLAQHFLLLAGEKIGNTSLRFSRDALTYMENYSWPGNVRELENCIEYAAIYCEGDKILPEHLPARIFATGERDRLIWDENELSLKRGKARMEKELIRLALRQCDGNKSRAAEKLEISYPALLSKIKQYSL